MRLSEGLARGVVVGCENGSRGAQGQKNGAIGHVGPATSPN